MKKLCLLDCHNREFERAYKQKKQAFSSVDERTKINTYKNKMRGDWSETTIENDTPSCSWCLKVKTKTINGNEMCDLKYLYSCKKHILQVPSQILISRCTNFQGYTRSCGGVAWLNIAFKLLLVDYLLGTGA